MKWYDKAWSPMTGCTNVCDKCKPKKLADKLGGNDDERAKEYEGLDVIRLHEALFKLDDDGAQHIAPYPFFFKPTLRDYELDDAKEWQEQRVLMCNQGDLFADDIPDKWIWDIMDACDEADASRYFFITRNVRRYGVLIRYGLIKPDKKKWFGIVDDGSSSIGLEYLWSVVGKYRPYVVIRPSGMPDKRFLKNLWRVDWVIIEKEGRAMPDKEWIVAIENECGNKPVFMDDKLKALMEDDFRQEFPVI